MPDAASHGGFDRSGQAVPNPIPGQEAANSDFLLERGAAAKVNRVEDLPYRIERLSGISNSTTTGYKGGISAGNYLKSV